MPLKRQTFEHEIFASMVALYSHAGMQDLCLDLQDRYDADIVLFFFFVLADRRELGCNDAGLDEAVRFASEWREAVVLPLRKVRRNLKTRADRPGVHNLRETVKRAELAAERLQAEALVREISLEHCTGDLARRYLTRLRLPDGERESVLRKIAQARHPAA